MHIVTLAYVAGLAEIDAAISDHVAWLDGNYADGAFIASGRQEPRVGGVIFTAGITRQDLDKRLALDPFNKRGLAEYTVVTFNPSRTALGLERLIAR
jgi:uncharacterized protein YciI